MRRRRFVALMCGALAVRLARAQTAKVLRVGFLGSATAAAYTREVEALRAGLRDFGYVEGRNLVLELRWADERYERLPEVAAELIRLKVDVIVTHAIPGVRGARQATATLPIVAADSGDLVGTGLVASLARPGGNITGSVSFQPEINAKRLDLLKEVAPRIERIGFLFNPANPAVPLVRAALQKTADSLKVDLQGFGVRSRDEFADAFSAMAAKKVEAVVIQEEPMLNAGVAPIAKLVAQQRLPSIGIAFFAEAGGLLGYGADRMVLYRRAAYFVDRIAKGANPGDVPIERASQFELVANLKAARALGLKIPPAILARADRAIE